MRSFMIMAIVAGLALAAGCGSKSDHELGPAFAATHMTPAGHAIEASDHIAEDPAFADALVEIDIVHERFERALGDRYPITLVGIRFVGHAHGPESDAMRARYIGDGVIEACVHGDRYPRVFCLPGAYSAMAQAQNPDMDASFAWGGIWQARAGLVELYPWAAAEID